MHRTVILKPLSLSNQKQQSKSMSKFVHLNQNREVQPINEWKPLGTPEKIIQRTHSLKKDLTFGGSYSNRKSILVTLNRNQSAQKKKPLLQQEPSSIKRQFDAEALLKSKLNLTPVTKKQNQSLDVNKNLKTFEFSSPKKEKMQTKYGRFMNSTTQFNKKVENQLTAIKFNTFRQGDSHNKNKVGSFSDRKVKSVGLSENRRLVGVIAIRRYGLRIRLRHVITQLCVCDRVGHLPSHSLQRNKRLNQHVGQMLSLPYSQNKTFYYFRVNKEPLTSSKDLPQGQNVILALQSAIINIESENYMNLCEEAQRLSEHIRGLEQKLRDKQRFETEFGSTNRTSIKSLIYQSPVRKYNGSEKEQQQSKQQSTLYDHQLITDVDSYVQKIVQNPEIIRLLSNRTKNTQKSTKNEILTLYGERFDSQLKNQTGESLRNPLLEDHSHYHREVKEKRLLSRIADRLQEYQFIDNPHIARRESADHLLQERKLQEQEQLRQQANPDIISRNITNTLQSKKSIIRQLDSKHPLLFEQNIPYMINKYGINRYEIHNLFTIYKTLQKISAMRYLQQDKTNKILKKGIDRVTFDEGMKRLDINPGDQVIKNICFFDDFISWEHFIKIVSIGLRKTPEEKLEAILIGIGGTSNGQLTKAQISILIGNSLTKIFDSDQVELREYFTQVAMRDLDADGSGAVDVEEIKKKCLDMGKRREGENMDLVSFLLLNS